MVGLLLQCSLLATARIMPSTQVVEGTTVETTEYWNVACEYGPQATVLSCPAGKLMQVRQAFFGAWSESASKKCAAPKFNKTCVSSDVTAVETACDGKNSCSIPNDPTVRPNPPSAMVKFVGFDACVDHHKYLLITYNCVPAAAPPPPRLASPSPSPLPASPSPSPGNTTRSPPPPLSPPVVASGGMQGLESLSGSGGSTAVARSPEPSTSGGGNSAGDLRGGGVSEGGNAPPSGGYCSRSRSMQLFWHRSCMASQSVPCMGGATSMLLQGSSGYHSPCTPTNQPPSLVPPLLQCISSQPALVLVILLLLRLTVTVTSQHA